jgi:hypothetical protein
VWTITFKPKGCTRQRQVTIDPTAMVHRLLVIALQEATAAYWYNMADDYDSGKLALPLSADQATIEAAPKGYRVALACRRHAWLLETDGQEGFEEEVWSFLAAEPGVAA